MLTAIEVWSQSLERAVYATVVTQAGAPVDDLLAADFVVKENGSALKVRSVSRAVDPLDIAVLVILGSLASTGVPTALAEIASDINHQYRIDYTRPAATAAPDLVDVSVRQSGLAVRATRFAPKSSASTKRFRIRGPALGPS